MRVLRGCDELVVARGERESSLEKISDHPSTHIPGRPKRGEGIGLGTHGPFGNSADTIRARADAVKLNCRYATTIAPDAAGIASRLTILEPWRRREVERGEGARLAQGMRAWHGRQVIE